MPAIDNQPLTISVPLRYESTGAIRVGDSRVLLELVIRAFQAGETPEAIVQSYDALALPDVYAVLSYYLTNAAAVEDYLRQRDAAAAGTRARIEAAQPARPNLRDILLARSRSTILPSWNGPRFGIELW